ncbi:MAG TPA: glycine cleavage system aminomethyltransferase GcvT [Hypericibacter adhaerens]|uniref:glycine cleavage system aminomethyltransferase GcvT n=1 Tax=Hypericibacter adhaerens TaxID=2602016 RepID=UPI002C3DD1E7|nr:glycine cleavage system aminomethyltransferase GcvT [Hypericibacter adhaerens]HWA44569.1 glycine cleavage system aminomethyltransferase GcvT [Hypericibacter adhaerens]
MTSSAPSADLKTTPLHALHRALGAKMVPFAGYDMPVQYPAGILAEHLHTRAAAGLFDVSHMGQLRLSGANPARALETLVPADIVSLAPMRQRYTQFTDENGGILDDLMVTHAGDHLFLVVNADCKEADLAHLKAKLPAGVTMTPLPDQALLALQGPKAAAVLARFAPEATAMTFMSAATLTLDGVACFVTRSGYTGEDGYEISIPAEKVEAFARRLLDQPEVKPIGLGARDSLRLEAGLCLYGHDIDTTTSPVEADLVWSIGKRRRAEGGFPGAARIQRELKEGTGRKRVGILPEGRAPVRDGTELIAGGRAIGKVTSGGFGPSLGGPVAMGYVETGMAKIGQSLEAMVRGKALPARVAALPFVKTNYYRG